MAKRGPRATAIGLAGTELTAGADRLAAGEPIALTAVNAGIRATLDATLPPCSPSRDRLALIFAAKRPRQKILMSKTTNTSTKRQREKSQSY